MKKTITTGLVAGFVMLLVSMATGWIFNAMIPVLGEEYMNASLFRPWSDPIMSLYYLYPFILGIVLSWVWTKTRTLFSGTEARKRGIFALSYWAITNIPGMFITYSSFPVSVAMVVSWSISSLVQVYAGSWVLAKMTRK